MFVLSFYLLLIGYFVVIYYLVYINQGYIFHQIVSKPKIYLWLNKGENKKKYLELQKSFDRIIKYAFSPLPLALVRVLRGAHESNRTPP